MSAGRESSSMSDSSSDDLADGASVLRNPHPWMRESPPKIMMSTLPNHTTTTRRLSPGSLALLPVDTRLANHQSQDQIKAAINAHSPRSAMVAGGGGGGVGGSGGGRGGPSPPPTPYVPGPSPSSHSDARSVSSSASSMGSPQALSKSWSSNQRTQKKLSPSRGNQQRSPTGNQRSPIGNQRSPIGNQRSPIARLAFALSPMGDPTQGQAMVDERKKARAARRAAQKALKKSGQQTLSKS